MNSNENYEQKNLLIESLVKRISKNSLKEVIIATSATIEGQTTAHYIEDTIKEKKLFNTLLLPYTPQDKFNDALNCCDALLVTIAKGIDGISFPSKLYTSLSVGRPIIAFSSENSELRKKVEGNDVGCWVELGDTDAFVEKIRYLINNPDEAKAMGKRARDLLVNEYSIKVSGKKYFDVLQKGFDAI